MKVVQLSDLHIGKSNNLEKARCLVDWILTEQALHQAEVVLISGDVVDDGEDWQFRQAAELASSLRQGGYPVLAVPGNHDYGPNGILENPRSPQRFRELISLVDEYPAVFLVAGQAFVLLDSMQEEIRTRELWGAQGYLGSTQLDKLDRILAGLESDPAVENVVVALHHHPFDYLFFHGLRDHADFKGVIARRLDSPPRVNALLFGHKHLDHRFNDPDADKESLYGIDLIYASGQSVERNAAGRMVLPVIDLETKTIERHLVP